jgi:molybdate transport system permease protein
MTPLWNYLLTAVLAAFLALTISALAARVRFSAPRKAGLALDLLFLLPLAIPLEILVSMVGFPDGSMSELLAVTLLAVMEIICALPVFYLCAVMGFRRVDREAIDAARLQGLGRCGIFWRLFFPAAWPWLLGGLAVGLFRAAFLAAFIPMFR